MGAALEAGRVSGRPINILVLDDDPAILDLVGMALQTSGYHVWPALSVSQALDLLARRGLPHLAIVDLMMPDEPGMTFCETVHAYSDLPCIILSAVDDTDTVVQGLRAWAEDYVIKPFHVKELMARVRRVLLRVENFAYAESQIIHVDGCLSVDFVRQRAMVRGRPVALTPIESKILFVLMRSPGHPLHADYILRRVWPAEEVFEDTLRVHMHRLRQKIDPGADEFRHIVTERNVGYRFEAEPGSRRLHGDPDRGANGGPPLGM